MRDVEQIICSFLSYLVGYIMILISYLDVILECLEDIVDLVFETTRQHLVSFIQHKHTNVVCVCNIQIRVYEFQN